MLYLSLTKQNKKKGGEFNKVLLLQALVTSSGFGPVIILGLICPARVSPTTKTSTLISEHMHIQHKNMTRLWTGCVPLAYLTSSTDLNSAKEKLFQF